MSYDAAVQMRSGETMPLYGSLSVTDDSGLTISAATVTLYNDAGTAVDGHSAVAATGYDTGTSGTVRAWYRLVAPATAGWYRLVFSITATGTDGIARLYKPEILVQVTAVP